jgi:hypothetical protein
LADDNASADDLHSLYVRQFEEAAQAGVDGRRESEKARDYVDGKQFTAAEERRLRKRKQPITPINMVRSKVESCCGLERQSRTDPKAYPRTQVHESEANAATDALRYVAEDQDLDIKKSRVFDNMLVEGVGGVEVTARQLRDGTIDPYVVRIAWNRIYADPHSSEADYSDATYTGYITWMDAEKAKRQWSEQVAVIESTMSKNTSATWDDFDDKPKWSYWSDSKRNRIRVNTHYHLVDGVWHRCVFTLAGELEPSAPSVFLDDQGVPENPLILQSAYVDRDNDRYGIVRDMIPIQDGINKRHSKLLHSLSNSKIRVSRSVGTDADAIRREYARADGVLIGEEGEIQELGNSAKEAGQFQLLQQMEAMLKGNIGPNAYLSGKQGDGQSGKAILAQQQAGMTELAPLLDNLRHFTLRMYRQIWNRIRQFWNTERWIRVTDDDSNIRFVVLNQRPLFSPAQMMAALQRVQTAVQTGELDQATAQEYALRVQKMATVQNPVGELDVDIDIEEVQDAPTVQYEQYQDLLQLLGTGLMQPSPPMLRLVIQAGQFRDKSKLLEIIDQMEKQAAAPNPAQDLQLQAGQAQVAVKQADVGKTQAETALTMARARAEQAQAIAAGLQLNRLMGPQPGVLG